MGRKPQVFIGRTRKMPLLHCPHCGSRVDGATPVCLSDENPMPTSGSITFCCYCGTVLIFEENISTASGLSLRRASWAEVERVKSCNPQISKLIDTMNDVT